MYEVFLQSASYPLARFVQENHLDCAIEICRLVRGIPLAVELAASWLKTISCHDTLAGIRQSMDFLHTNAPDAEERHRSIRAVFDYVWTLLLPSEQRVLRRLSVFRGEFGLIAAQQVAMATPHSLSVLVDHSLVEQTATDHYQLHSLLRQYAQEKLHVGQHGKQSKLALTLLALMDGEFEKLESLAKEFIQESSDELNADKGFGMAIFGIMAGVVGDADRCLQLCASSLPMTQGMPIALFFSHLGLAIGYCEVRDFANAKATVKHAQVDAHTLHLPSLMILCLPVIAILHGRDTDHTAAVITLGCLASQHLELPEWLREWKLFKNTQNALARQLSKTDYAAAWQLGAAAKPQNLFL